MDADDVDPEGAVDFEAECALLELACTQPDVDEQAAETHAMEVAENCVQKQAGFK